MILPLKIRQNRIIPTTRGRLGRMNPLKYKEVTGSGDEQSMERSTYFLRLPTLYVLFIYLVLRLSKYFLKSSK